VSVNAPEALLPYRDRVEALAADDPAWAAERRREALAAFGASELPNRPRTPLKTRRLEQIPAWDPGHADPPPTDLAADAAVLLGNGRILSLRLPPAWTTAGARVMSLRAALREHPVEDWLDRTGDDDDRFTALHRALWSDGLYVYLPRGAKLDHPLTVVHWVGGDAAGVFPRVLVVAEPEAEANIVDLLLGDPADTHRVLVSGITEVVAQDGATVRYSAIQQLPPGAEAFLHRHGVVARDALVSWNTAEFGGALVVADHHSRLAGSGGRARSATVFFGSGAQHQDYTAGVLHLGPHTASDILARGVMRDRARSIFTGQSVIRKGAVRADARQKEQTLMLSDQARADAIPSLIIEDNDVYAAHAASAGPVDATALYYLESRGIPEEMAVRLVVHGFLEPVVSQIDLPAVREWIRHAVDRKLGWRL
jgi:Fe-S cluster assembly protein SufD